MAKDLAEREREFIDQLATDTGRDLSGWMSAIQESGQDNRNAIIDWLRQQGFAFPKASWLERIHHNGGRLIYGAEGPTAADIQRQAELPRVKGESAHQPANLETAKPCTSPPNPSVEAAHEEIIKLLAAAKGLRPLAELVTREIDMIVPSARKSADGAFVNFGQPNPFAALLPQAKELRLFANFGPETRDRTRKADAVRFGARFPDVMVLSDARQIDERFRQIIAHAYRRSL